MRGRFARVTTRRLMLVVAASGILLAWVIDRDRQGCPLVDFEYYRVVMNEPLVNAMKARAVDRRVVLLEDGREIHIDSGPLYENLPDLRDYFGSEEWVVDVEADSGGLATVYMLSQSWSCGNTYVSPFRIPLFARTIYQNYRNAVATGRVVGPSPTGG
jgi:hypothetical protein